jgi:hypothetical protein
MPPSCGNVNAGKRATSRAGGRLGSGRHYPFNLFHQFAQVEGFGQDLGASEGWGRPLDRATPANPVMKTIFMAGIEFCAPAG